LTPPIYDLNIVHLEKEGRIKEFLDQTTEGSFSSTSEKSVLSTPSKKQVFGFLHFEELGTGALGLLTIDGKCARLNELRRSKKLGGLVIALEAAFSAAHVNDLLNALRSHDTDVVLMCDPDAYDLNMVNFELVSGILFVNACILPNGQYRDFFRAAALREGIGRCCRQRKERPGFLTGFLEIWDEKPSAATVRRATKLAGFYDAVLEVRPRVGLMREKQIQSLEEPVLSGFDYLKRPEIIEVSICATLFGTMLILPSFNVVGCSKLNRFPTLPRRTQMLHDLIWPS